MWKAPLATAFVFFTLVSPVVAEDTNSISELQRNYDKAYRNQQLFDSSNVLTDRTRKTTEPSALAPDTHAGRNADGKQRPTVELNEPKQQAQEAQGGMMAGNPPTSTLLGLTELKYPYEKASHYGPPTYYEYYLLFRYTPPPTVTSLDVGKQFGSQAAAQSWFQKAPTTFGIPITDSADYINKMTANAKLVDQITSPSRWTKVTEAWQQAQQQDMAGSTAKAGEVQFAADLANIESDLHNIANEYAARPAAVRAKTRSIDEVTWMVQQVYKKIYIPIAILLILPGAVLTQGVSMVSFGFRLPARVSTPFDGLLKAMIAIFLIPATQLIVSYSIDVGNTMTHAIASYKVDGKDLMAYVNAQLYDVPLQNASNQLVPPWENSLTRDPALEDDVIFDLDALLNSIISGISNFFGSIGSWLGFGGGGSMPNPLGGSGSAGGGIGSALGLGGSGNGSGGTSPAGTSPMARGKVTQAPEELSQLESQSRMTTQMQYGTNAVNMINFGVVSVLLEFQTVMMCYLMLLGPIAAALYAWPLGGALKNAFASWLNGVITLSMWRFWWCVILLVMHVRIQWLKDMGEYKINSEWEALVMLSFSVMMAAVPFNPFVFKVGDLADGVLKKASENVNKAGQDKGGAAGSAGGGGGNAAGAANAGGGGGASKSASSMSPGTSHQDAESSGRRNDGSDGERKRTSGSNPSANDPAHRAPLKDEPDTPPSGPPPMVDPNSATVSAQGMSTPMSEMSPPPISREGAEA